MKTAYCFDLDGTVTATEILPCIAADLGVADEVATLTRLTMLGQIPFESSFRLRCAILGSIEPARVSEIIRAIPLNEPIVDFIREQRENAFIVTGNLDIWVGFLAEAWGCRLISSSAIYTDNRLRLTHILNKGQAIQSIRAAGEFSRVIAIGDGANDVPMLSSADVGVSYGGVHAPAGEALLASRFVVHDGDTLCKLLRAL